jgi:hypothetical protein
LGFEIDNRDYHYITQAQDGTWTDKVGYSGQAGATDVAHWRSKWGSDFHGCFCVKGAPRVDGKTLQQAYLDLMAEYFKAANVWGPINEGGSGF